MLKSYSYWKTSFCQKQASNLLQVKSFMDMSKTIKRNFDHFKIGKKQLFFIKPPVFFIKVQQILGGNEIQ